MRVNGGLSPDIVNYIGPVLDEVVRRSTRPLHHFGVVVASLQGALPEGLQQMKLVEDSPILTDPVQRVSAIFYLHPDNGCRFELLEPAGERSPVTRFLERTGGGLHHVCFESANLEADVLRMQEEGARIICAPVSACGFRGARIAFVYTRAKLLVELVEAPVTYQQLSTVGLK